VQYSIPQGGLAAGQIFAYGVQFPQDKGTWQPVNGGTFDLSATVPDNIIIYCMNADDKPHFLSALIYNTAGFQKAGAESYNFSETSMPASLAVHGALVLPFAPNYLYQGIRQGDKVELLAAFSDPANYKGSNVPYNIVTSAAVSAPILISVVAAVVGTITMAAL
jgi:hypothetical protein